MMMAKLQATLCCAFLLVAAASARPQVWNIGFNPNAPTNNQQNPFLPDLDDVNAISSTTTAAPVQATTPSQAFYACMARCPTTSQYNPVCGSDSVNYHNLGRLQCAAQCGQSVTAVRSGTCRPL